MWGDAEIHLESLERLQWVSAKEARVWRARILSEQGRHEEAVKVGKQVASPSYKDELVLAVVYVRAGEIGRAAREMNDALVSNKRDAQVALGGMLSALGDEETALVHLERAPLWYGAERERAVGQALFRLGDDREATLAFERTVRARPFLLEKDLSALAECYRRIGRERAAVRVESYISTG
jgi:tetratricopeptide (TPR) repeat protein